MDDLLANCARVKEYAHTWTAPDARNLHAVDRALDAICRQTTRSAALFKPHENPLLPDPTTSILAVLSPSERGGGRATEATLNVFRVPRALPAAARAGKVRVPMTECVRRSAAACHS